MVPGLTRARARCVLCIYVSIPATRATLWMGVSASIDFYRQRIKCTVLCAAHAQPPHRSPCCSRPRPSADTPAVAARGCRAGFFQNPIYPLPTTRQSLLFYLCLYDSSQHQERPIAAQFRSRTATSTSASLFSALAPWRPLTAGSTPSPQFYAQAAKLGHEMLAHLLLLPIGPPAAGVQQPCRPCQTLISRALPHNFSCHYAPTSTPACAQSALL